MTPDPRLLVQATPELLEGWCGPVVLPGRDMRGSIVAAGLDSIYVWADGGTSKFSASDLFVDLSRAECRDRVARVLAVSVGLGVAPGAISVMWDRLVVSDRLTRRFTIWKAPSLRAYVTFCAVDPGGYFVDDSDRWREVPALSALDPNDSTRLPDGSRIVDALALAEVWQAVGGGR